MKKNQENGLMMEEIAVKNLQEISGGALFIPRNTFNVPITTGAFHPLFLGPLSVTLGPTFPIGPFVEPIVGAAAAVVAGTK